MGSTSCLSCQILKTIPQKICEMTSWNMEKIQFHSLKMLIV